MELKRISKQNHYEAITEQLKSLIIGGQLKVGDKLPSTKEMSEQFGVGRSTTREALSALKAMGLIEIRQGGGCRIIRNAISDADNPQWQAIRLNRATLLELLEARQSLEIANAAMAAARRTDDELDAIKLLVVQMEQAIGHDLEGERTDLAFHLLLAKAAHNSIMLSLFESIAGQLEMAIREVRRAELYANQSVAKKLFKEHSGLFAAIEAQDADLAARRMKQHLQHVESILMKYV